MRPGWAAAVVAVVVAATGGCRETPAKAPPEATVPTVVVAGDPVPTAQMTDALANLCTARDEAPEGPQAAKDRFFGRSHTALHLIARALEDVDRSLAARLLEAKQKVEADFSGGASGGQVADDLRPLIVATAQGLDRLAVPVPPCAK